MSNTHRRTMVVTFVSGLSRNYTLKGERRVLEEEIIPHIGTAIMDREPFHVLAEDAVINPSHVMSVSFGPIEEHDGA